MKLVRFFKFFTILFFLCAASDIIKAQDIGSLKNQKPFILRGSFSTNLMAYTSRGKSPGQQPFSYVFSANASASFYGIDMPFSFTYSNRQKSFSQPFNRFGLSPHYKWVTIHLGYRALNFSQFTLSGQSFLGGGIELNPGKFRFGAIYGQFNRSTDPNTYNKTDTLATYKRKGLGIKIGVGGKKSFFDLIVLQIKDEKKSLPVDTTYPVRTPVENLVCGINSRISFSKSLFFEGEAAVSLFTDNQNALGFTGKDADLAKKAEKIIVVNQSSHYSTASRAALVYKIKAFSLKAEYKRIDPGYNSLGAYYFTTDVQSLAIGPSFSLFKNKFQFRGNIGLQSDNLRSSKKTTSKRTVGSANISFNPTNKFGIDGSYSNFTTNQKAGNLPLVDTSKVFQTNSTLSIAPRFTVMNKDFSHMIMLMINHTNLNDKNPKTEQLTENHVNTANLNYALGIIKQSISLIAGLNYMSMNNFSGTNKAMGVTAGIMGMAAKGKVSIGWTNSLLNSEYLSNKGKIFTSAANASYRLEKKHQFRLNIYFTGNYYSEGASVPSSKEIKGDLSYVYTF